MSSQDRFALRTEAPRLEPDDAFVQRLSQLAAASAPVAGDPRVARSGLAIGLAAASVAAVGIGAAWLTGIAPGQSPDPAPPPVSPTSTADPDPERTADTAVPAAPGTEPPPLLPGRATHTPAARATDRPARSDDRRGGGRGPDPVLPSAPASQGQEQPASQGQEQEQPQETDPALQGGDRPGRSHPYGQDRRPGPDENARDHPNVRSYLPRDRPDRPDIRVRLIKPVKDKPHGSIHIVER